MTPHPLKVERELRGWSQAKVAEAVGTNTRTVIRWEQGQTIPYPYYREQLCALFGKNARELGLLEEKASPTISTIPSTPAPEPPLQAIPPGPAISLAPSAIWKVPPIFMPLVGRSLEIAEVRDLLNSDAVRLLTLVGAGGIGKTRLSIQLAHEVWTGFTDGICFVALTAATAPEHVLSSIAHELDLWDESVPPLERVQRMLRDKQLLLVLDNFEQVMAAAPLLEQLLLACPGVKMLVTSRVVLHLALEHQYRLAPLAVPDLKKLSERGAMEQVAHYASVELFVQRARTLLPAFQVTEANAAALAEICVRLDGIPLAIELAAARIKLLPPQALLPRLSHSLSVLTKGLLSLPERHQTLRNTIRWSYDLLEEDEQYLFRLLSVFVGGFTVEAGEAVFAAVSAGQKDGTLTALDGLDSLIDKSLLHPAGAADGEREPRLEMLETIREYGRECLLEHGELELARQGHATFYLHYVEEVASKLVEPQQAMWLDRLEQEHSNLQAAMEWLLFQAEEGFEPGEKRAMALRLGSALGQFWLIRGYLREGWTFIEQALRPYGNASGDIYDDEAMLALANAYHIAAELIMRLGDLDRAETLLDQSIRLYRQLANTLQLANAIRRLGWVAHQKGETTAAYQHYEQTLALFKEVDDKKGIANTMLNMAYIVQTQGDYKQAGVLLEEVVMRQRAIQNKTGLFSALYQLAQVLFGAEEYPPIQRIRALLHEGLDIAREMGDQRGVSSMHGLLGWVALSQGNLAEARLLLEDCLQFYKEGGDRIIAGQYLALLAEVCVAQEDYGTAQELLAETLAMGKEIGSKTEVTAVALEGMAGLAAAQSNLPWTVRLWAAADRWREDIHTPTAPGQQKAYERTLEELRGVLGQNVFSSLWEEGRRLSPDEVWTARYAPLSTALDQPGVGTARPRKKVAAYPAGLSAREVEVLRLVAQGLSDAQIAEQLILSTRTVTTHLTAIFNKIGSNSRTAAVRFASEHHLL